MAEAFFWCRDMINTPAEDMSPQDLAAEAAALAAAHAGELLVASMSVAPEWLQLVSA
jgi:leucyl aminopeptidase